MHLLWSEGIQICCGNGNATIEDAHGNTYDFPEATDAIKALATWLQGACEEEALINCLQPVMPGQRPRALLRQLLSDHLIEPFELCGDLAELHLKTTIKAPSASEPDLSCETERHIREFGGLGFDLVPPAPVHAPLSQMLAARTSCRHFSGDAISGEHISALLSSAVGSPSFDPECRPKPLLAGGPVGHRGYPSGGALYFVEVLVALLHVEGATCGIYNYQPLPHRLAVRRAPLTPQAIAEQFANEHLEDASLILLFFLDFTRVSFAKYSLKSYRLALLEAGHLAQNTVLTAAGLGLSSVPICGFDDRCLTEMAGLRYPEQPVIYAVAVGEAAKKSNL